MAFVGTKHSFIYCSESFDHTESLAFRTDPVVFPAESPLAKNNFAAFVSTILSPNLFYLSPSRVKNGPAP